ATIMSVRPFHLAVPVDNLQVAREFYTNVVGCGVGRESDRWIDFDFFGHQVTVHLVDKEEGVATNPVDGDAVPSRHFGVILEMDVWQKMADRLQAAGTEFLIAPRIR